MIDFIPIVHAHEANIAIAEHSLYPTHIKKQQIRNEPSGITC